MLKILLCIQVNQGNRMRTTLDLPESLVAEAMKITNIKTKTKVIITALEQLLKQSKISEIKKYKGKEDLDIDLDEIRGRNVSYN
jgi:Arc/MetJ family transcription regulator